MLPITDIILRANDNPTGCALSVKLPFFPANKSVIINEESEIIFELTCNGGHSSGGSRDSAMK